MGVGIIKFISLSEAKAFLDDARTLPRYSERSNRSCRASVLLSWASLEAAVSYEFKKCNLKHPKPDNLGNRLGALAQAKHVTFDKPAYVQQRKLRNRITHPDDAFVWMCPEVGTATEVFDYCLGLIKQLYSIGEPWY